MASISIDAMRAHAPTFALTAALIVAGILSASDPAGADVCRVTQFSGAITHGQVEGIAAGPDGNMWFTEAGGSGAIGRITPQGQVTEFTEGLTHGAPQGNTAGPDGNLWFTESAGGGAIGRITPQGEITEFTQGITPDNSPAGIAAGPDGNLWFGENGDVGTIARITAAGAVTEFTAGDSEFTAGLTKGVPLGIAAGPDGNLWFTEGQGAGAIARITPQGAVTEFPSHGNASEIAPGPGASMWFTEPTGAIGRIMPSGRVAVFSHGIAANSSPKGIAAGPDGNLWFTEVRPGSRSGAIARMTPAGQVSEFTFTPNLLAWDIAAGPDRHMWFTEFGGRIGRIPTGCSPAGGGPRPTPPTTVQAPRHHVSATRGFRLEVTLQSAQMIEVKVYQARSTGTRTTLAFVGLLSHHGRKGRNELKVKLVHGHRLRAGRYELVVYTVTGSQTSKARTVRVLVGKA
jgi:streptogramin lyase